MRSRIPRLVTVISLLMMSACGLACTICATQSYELERRGDDLHRAIVKAYPTYNSLFQSEAQATLLVQEYIPIGTSFEDAKAILVAAGFRCEIVNKAMNPGYMEGNVFPALVATYSFETNSIWLDAEISIKIVPKVPGDFHSNIAKVLAHTSFAMP